MTQTEQASQLTLGLDLDSDLAIAISHAVRMSLTSGENLTVLKTKSFGLCVWTDFKIKMTKHEIESEIYSTLFGFHQQLPSEEIVRPAN